MNEELALRLGIAAHCLFTISTPNCRSGACLYTVMESRDLTFSIPPHCNWLAVMQSSGEALSEEEHSAVLLAVHEVQDYQSGLKNGPFGKTGWIEELLGWVQRQIEPLGYMLSGGVRQFNASPTFALLRFETNGPAVWFKAVGEPNQSELPIVITLSRLLPLFVPRLIASDPSLNGWLTVECQGLTLQEAGEVASWETAAEILARLQIESRRVTRELLQAGCRDIRIPALLDRVDPFMEVICELMDQQTKDFPAALSRNEVLALGEDIKKALAAWMQLGIPDTLGHLDLNPGNIVVVSDGHCVFLDWAEACIGPPFLTFDFLRAHFRQTQFALGGGTARIAERYGDKWNSLLSAVAIKEGLDLASLLAPYAYAVGTDLWRDEQQGNSNTAGYFRSLVRRMQRQSGNLRERGSSCLSL